MALPEFYERRRRELLPELEARAFGDLFHEWIVKERARRLRQWRPRLVVDHGRVIADATVIVSEKDMNWWHVTKGVVEVRKEKR